MLAVAPSPAPELRRDADARRDAAAQAIARMQDRGAGVQARGTSHAARNPARLRDRGAYTRSPRRVREASDLRGADDKRRDAPVSGGVGPARAGRLADGHPRDRGHLVGGAREV